MKRTLLIGILYSITVVALAQTVIEQAWTTSTSEEGLQQIDTRINELVSDLDKHHYRSEVRKLNALFVKTHNRFLNTYDQYAGIEGLVKGHYDCLTATSLFADILSRAGYKYKIIETNYHIFIVVNTSDGDVLLETTDRFSGFIDDEEKMKNVIARYQKNTLPGATAQHHQYSFSLFETVEVNQLPGLLYFNQAVKAFNAEKWDECSEKLSAAKLTTNSPRIGELTALLQSRSLR